MEEELCPHTKICKAYEIKYGGCLNLDCHEVITFKEDKYLCLAAEAVECSHISLLNMLSQITNKLPGIEKRLRLINMKAQL